MSKLMYVVFLAIFCCVTIGGLCTEWTRGWPQKPQRGCASAKVRKSKFCSPL